MEAGSFKGRQPNANAHSGPGGEHAPNARLTRRATRDTRDTTRKTPYTHMDIRAVPPAPQSLSLAPRIAHHPSASLHGLSSTSCAMRGCRLSSVSGLQQVNVA